tara:strand:+ start:111 stop:500 length:390 start_codon:yes stop_codon:yes gene_type:complete
MTEDQNFSQEELIKLKSSFDEQSESQDDVWESESWDFKEEYDDDICKKSVIIWAMSRYSEDDGEENKYEIKVEFRRYDEDDEIYEEDESIESFVVSLGYAKENLGILNDAINCFIENGGKRSNLEFLLK